MALPRLVDDTNSAANRSYLEEHVDTAMFLLSNLGNFALLLCSWKS
jgi:hypothetical protein